MDSKTRKILIALLVMIAMIIVAGLVGILLYANSSGALLTGSIGGIDSVKKEDQKKSDKKEADPISPSKSNGGLGQEKTPEKKAQEKIEPPVALPASAPETTAPAEAVSNSATSVAPTVAAPTSSPESTTSTSTSPSPAPQKVRRVAK